MKKNYPAPDQQSIDKAWLEEAFLLAQRAEQEDEVPVGAIVVKGGQVIGRGYNRRVQSNDPLAHAELLAIQAASLAIGDWRLEDCTLYVTLEPCPMCLAACQQGRIPRVVYGAKDPKGGALSLGYRIHEDTRTNHRFTVEYLEHGASGQILRDFFGRKRAK